HPGVGYRRYPRSQSLRYRWCRKTADTRFPMSWFVSLQSPRRGSQPWWALRSTTHMYWRRPALPQYP
ncbi:50S ribosomal protein L35, partial [Dysosmobacter welbionis]